MLGLPLLAGASFPVYIKGIKLSFSHDLKIDFLSYLFSRTLKTPLRRIFFWKLRTYARTYLHNFVEGSPCASRQLLVNLLLRVFDEVKKGRFISTIFLSF